ncbi:MAG: SulP family inorganic anion transporter [Acidithiobacillus sp.]
MQSLSRFEENKINILSGITVALALVLVPEAIAFAFVAHVSPLTGLYAAVILVFITSLWGGRPSMVSGASGATVVVMVVSHGAEYLFAAVILIGLLQLFFAAARLSKFVRLIPHPVMLGFINGLAIVIFMAQLEHFKIKDAQGAMVWMHGTPLYIMIGLVALTMVAIYLTPRITKAIPATLAGALLTTLLVVVFKIPTVTVGDVASLAGGLPSFHLPEVPLNWHTLVVIFPYALVMAANGLVETLLTLNLIDEMTDTRGKPNQESMAQGLANVVSGFFGAMGGCAMLGESIINVGNGAIKRLSGVTTALFLLSFIVLASHWIQQVPIAALVGVMFVVVEKTFEWSSLRFFGRVPRTRARISCRRSCGKALLGRRPRRRDTKPWGPSPRSRASNRLTWRTLIPSRAAASCCRMRRSATCCITPTRSTSLRLIVRFPSTHTPPSMQRGHFRIVQRGHYCFGLTNNLAEIAYWYPVGYTKLHEHFSPLRRIRLLARSSERQTRPCPHSSPHPLCRAWQLRGLRARG